MTGTRIRTIELGPDRCAEVTLAESGSGRTALVLHGGGGPATVRQFLAAGLIDHMHIPIVPILLGRGESLWDGLEGLEERFTTESVSSPSGGVTHVTFTRRQPRLVWDGRAATTP